MSDTPVDTSSAEPADATARPARPGLVSWFGQRSLMWWLWGSLIVSSLHLLEEIFFFDPPGLHHIYFGFDGPARWSAFVLATGKQTLFHLVMIGIAAWAGGRWRRYITQFFAIILLVASGFLFIWEAIANQGYVAGVVTGVFVCTPFFILCVADLIRQGELTWPGLVGWLIAAPGAALAVIYGWLI